MKKIALVTGANQGLGFALAQNLSSYLKNDGLIYLTGRNIDKVKEACSKIKNDNILAAYLDVTNNSSIDSLAKTIKAKHGGLDIIISNAAARMSKNKSQSEQVKSFIETNNFGLYKIIMAFNPLLKNNATFITIASSFGSLRYLDPSLYSYFDVDNMHLEDINNSMSVYVEDVENGLEEQKKWGNWINIPSKIGQVATTKIFAKTIENERPRDNIKVYAVCPGLIDTEASRPWFDDMSFAQSPNKASKDIIWLITSPNVDDNFYGQLVQHRKIIPWN